MISVRSVLREVPDTRGKKGQVHRLEAILGLILLSMLNGRTGMKAAFHLGRSLSRKQLDRLGVRRDRQSPCHATLTETLRVLDPDAMARVFGGFTAGASDEASVEIDLRHIAIDGKTLRGSKDADGKAEHVLSAFCAALEQSLGHTSSRGKGREIPDALRLLETIDLEGMIVTGDAIFCQKTIASSITQKGGDYLLPVKTCARRSKRLSRSRFFPLIEAQDPPRTGHGRIDLRGVALLPADALSEHIRTAWPSVRTVVRITREREHIRAGRPVKRETETVYLITSLAQPTPEYILRLNRKHWQVETMHRDKDVILGEDRYTNRSDNAPRNIFSLTSAARTLLKRISKSPTRAIETVQENRQKAIRFISDPNKNAFL
jgi:predicted transposase YbfD/YdcC